MNKSKNYKTEVNEKEQLLTAFFDGFSDEPQLWEYRGFDDPGSREVYARAYNRIDASGCETCFYRLSFIDRVTQGVLQLRRREY